MLCSAGETLLCVSMAGEAQLVSSRRRTFLVVPPSIELPALRSEPGCVLQELLWLPIDFSAQIKEVVITYKALYDLGPRY